MEQKNKNGGRGRRPPTRQVRNQVEIISNNPFEVLQADTQGKGDDQDEQDNTKAKGNIVGDKGVVLPTPAEKSSGTKGKKAILANEASGEDSSTEQRNTTIVKQYWYLS